MMYRATYCEAEAGSERMITFMVASLFVEGMAGEKGEFRITFQLKIFPQVDLASIYQYVSAV